MIEPYYFTVTTGRAGQASLSALLQHNVPGCHAAFEEPNIITVLPNPLGHYERRLRRRFVETHELLGRGKVITAFEAGDETYLDAAAVRRLRYIDKRLRNSGCSIYVDVSKYFARGLHRALLRRVPKAGLIRLVRDPILNMRSFLNRNKDFRLDNGLPDAPNNIFHLDSAELDKSEYYLWAWCEMYLRFDSLVAEFGITRAVEIRTDELEDPARMAVCLDNLGLPHGKIAVDPPQNTNFSQGYGTTEPEAAYIATFQRFINKIPTNIRERIPYLDDYQPAHCA